MSPGILDRALVSDAIRRRKFAVLKSHLDTLRGRNFSEELSTLVRLSSNLILAHEDKNREKARDKFLNELLTYAEANMDGFETVADAVGQIQIAESGYRKIIAALHRSEFWKLSSTEKVSAVLARAKLQCDFVQVEVLKAFEKQRVHMIQGLTIKDGLGVEVSPDSIMEPLVADAGSSLKMLAYEHGWVGNQGEIIIPNLAPTSKDDMFKAGSNEVLAHAWQHWSWVEEEARFLDGRLSVKSSIPLLVEGRPEIAELIQLQRSGAEWYNWAAQVRMNDHAAQDIFTLMTKYRGMLPIGSLPNEVPLPPVKFVSESEALANNSLDHLLAIDIQTDTEEVEGLRIAEWLRGLAILSVIADPASGFGAIPGLDLPVFDEGQLIDVLSKVGLSAEKAAIFVRQMTFKWSSRDLFDAPLIKQFDGRIILFTPALKATNHANVLMSIFSTMDVDFARKGKAFEARVIKDLIGRGLDARPVKVKRGGEEYEFDILMPWGDFLFLFECKNRSIPRGRAIDQRQYRSTTDEQIEQVNRLAVALKKWPDILSNEFGRDLSALTLVPIVLNNLSYARSGPTDGVYFYDYSALTRFFTSGSLSMKIPISEHGPNQKLLEIPTVKMWAGYEVASTDLVNELEDPAQLRFKRFHTYVSPMEFWLDSRTICEAPMFREHPMTPLTAADFAGIPRRQILDRLERAKNKFKKAVRRAEIKQAH